MNWILATLAFALLAGFLAIVASFVPEPDLVIVFVVALALCGIDFVRELLKPKKNGNGR